jgi:hypothetical protein
LFEGEEVAVAKKETQLEYAAGLENMNEDLTVLSEKETEFLPITTKAYLYLSGTPFKALATGEFIEEQIFNWTYTDEQRAKQAFAKKFPNKGDVRKWLDIIRGSYAPRAVESLKTGTRPPFPYSDTRLLPYLQHSFWFLPNVAACHAMANLLTEKHNVFWHDHEVIVAAGTTAGIGLEALPPVRKAIGGGFETKTITLSCGKLTTGVTVPQWSSILMLRNLTSPETYFQAAFRVQSPWSIMYLTDFRENTLQDVITKIESGLFQTVTGLTVADFHLLVRLKVFNTEQMNQAVFAFRRYEDASLRYTGIESHKGLSHYGLYDTVVARE